MGERAAAAGALMVMFLVFVVLLLYTVPQFQSWGIVSKPEMFGLAYISELTGIPPHAIVSALISGIIALSAGLLVYLRLTKAR